MVAQSSGTRWRCCAPLDPSRRRVDGKTPPLHLRAHTQIGHAACLGTPGAPYWVWNAFRVPIHFQHAFDSSEIRDLLSGATAAVHSTADGHTLSWTGDESAPWHALLGRLASRIASRPSRMVSSHDLLVGCAACSSVSDAPQEVVRFGAFLSQMSCGPTHCLGVSAGNVLVTWGSAGDSNLLLRSAETSSDALPTPVPDLLAHGVASQVTCPHVVQHACSELMPKNVGSPRAPRGGCYLHRYQPYRLANIGMDFIPCAALRLRDAPCFT